MNNSTSYYYYSDNNLAQGSSSKVKIANDFENKFDIYFVPGDRYAIECDANANPDIRRTLSTVCDSDNDDQWMWGSSSKSLNTVTAVSSGSSSIATDYVYYFDTQEKLVSAVTYLKEVVDIELSLEVEMLLSSSIEKVKNKCKGDTQ